MKIRLVEMSMIEVHLKKKIDKVKITKIIKIVMIISY